MYLFGLFAFTPRTKLCFLFRLHENLTLGDAVYPCFPVPGCDLNADIPGMGGKKLLHYFRPVIVLREMRKDEQFQEKGTVAQEKIQRLPVRQVAFSSVDPVLQRLGVPSVFQHVLVIV